MELALFGASASGRHVQVILKGRRRDARTCLARLLPELRATEVSQRLDGSERIRGVLPHAGAPAVAGKTNFWEQLSALERTCLGHAGAVFRVEVWDQQLLVSALVESKPSEGDLARVTAPTGDGFLLFEPNKARVTLHQASLGGQQGPTEPRLKPTEIEAGRTALTLGYYDDPRRCTMDDIARALGLTKSAVCRRLHGFEQKSVRLSIRMYHGPQEPAGPTGPPPPADRGL